MSNIKGVTAVWSEKDIQTLSEMARLGYTPSAIQLCLEGNHSRAAVTGRLHRGLPSEYKMRVREKKVQIDRSVVREMRPGEMVRVVKMPYIGFQHRRFDWEPQ